MRSILMMIAALMAMSHGAYSNTAARTGLVGVIRSGMMSAASLAAPPPALPTYGTIIKASAYAPNQARHGGHVLM